ncbi:MAG: restriction endonuclease subunit S [Oscillospiraceae bacterium]|nr:restriction endonuclease subunit S [Oscillospiraceae bacterium]
MSKLDELIRELCPNGVEHKKLLSVANVLYGYPCNASLFNTEGQGIPLARIRDVLDGESSTFTTEVVPDKYFLRTGDLLIGMDGNFHVANWKMDSGVLCQRVCKVYSNDNEKTVLNRYLAHLLKPLIKRVEDNKQSGTVKHLLDKDLKGISIPVPPIEVQREIVRILDNFTERTEKLKAELTAELTAQKKRYEYYRDKLLTFGVRGATSNVTWRTLGEVCDLKAGKAIPSYEISPEPTTEFCVPCYGGNGLRGYVRQANQQGAKSLIGRQGALCGNVCYATGDYYTTEHAIAVTNNGEFNNRFLYHLLVNENLNQYKTAGAQPGLSVSRLETITVPVPDIAVQDKIAYVLDNFDAICSDLNIGLPAEIEARKKQYEYYRDKLLSFDVTITPPQGRDVN